MTDRHALGKRSESDAALAELIRKYEREMPYNIAYVLAFRGEADRAFEWLDKAVAYHDGGLAEIVGQPAVREPPPGSALAAVPAQARQGAGTVGGDQVRREAAELSA